MRGVGEKGEAFLWLIAWVPTFAWRQPVKGRGTDLRELQGGLEAPSNAESGLAIPSLGNRDLGRLVLPALPCHP